MIDPTPAETLGKEDAAPEAEAPLPYHRKVLQAVGFAAGIGALLFVLWWIRWALAVIFAGILLGVLFRSGADLLARGLRPLVRLKPGQALALFLILLLLLGGAFFILAVPSLLAQVDELQEQVPQAVTDLKEQIRRPAWGQWLLEDSPVADGEAVPDDPEAVAGTVFNWAWAAISGAVALLFMFFTGLYMASEPGLYRRGVMWLVPPRGRKEAERVLDRSAHALRWWLAGQIVSMTIVGTLVGLGLWFLGAPMPLVGGVLAALLEFVPNIGPALAAGLPALLSLGAEGRFFDGPALAGAVLVMFFCIQTLESYLITPLVQRRAVELPPALLIMAQLVGAILLGPFGVIVAAPLVVVAMVLAQELLVVGDVEREHPKDRAHEEQSGNGRSSHEEKPGP